MLLRRDLKKNPCVYDFAISDFVLEGETDSLETLQRAMKESLGLDFFFGELAPALTTAKNKLITDYYLIDRYEVAIEELSFDKAAFFYRWATKEELFQLIKQGDLGGYTALFAQYVCELRENA